MFKNALYIFMIMLWWNAMDRILVLFSRKKPAAHWNTVPELLEWWCVIFFFFLLVVPKKSESSDIEESKIGNEGSDLEEPCVISHSPVTVDKRPLPVKSPKVVYLGAE